MKLNRTAKLDKYIQAEIATAGRYALNIQKKSIGRNVLFSILFSLAAKGLSFLQAIIVSWQYGAQQSTDILYFAIGFIITCTAICGTINQHVIIPNYIRIRDAESEGDAQRFANKVFLIYATLGFVGVAILCVFPVGIFSGISQFGLVALTSNINILRLAAPILLLMAINTLITDLFTAYKFFTMPMIVDMLKSGLVIAATILPWSHGNIVRLAQAMLLANLLQLVFLVCMMRVILKWKPVFGKVQLEKTVGTNVFYVILGQLIVFLADIVVMYLVSGFAEGVYTSMEYAQKVNTMIGTVIITQLTTIVGIQIIEHFNEKDFSRLNDVFSQYIKAGFYIVAPVCFCLSLCAKPVISILFERGEFTADAVLVSASFFSYFILIIPLTLLGEFINRLIIAHQIQKISVLWKIVFNVIVMASLFVSVRLWGYVGVPIGQLIAYLLYVLFLFVVLKRHFPYIRDEKSILFFIGKCVTINALLIFGLSLLFGGLLNSATFGGKVFALVVVGSVFFTVYMGISFLPGLFNKELRHVVAVVREKLSPQTDTTTQVKES